MGRLHLRRTYAREKMRVNYPSLVKNSGRHLVQHYSESFVLHASPLECENKSLRASSTLPNTCSGDM